MLVRIERAGEFFEWDSVKEQTNRAKHGIAFEQAVEALLDEFREIAYLPRGGEERMIALGQTFSCKLLLVVFLERSLATRIISSRQATNAERQAYESGS